MATRSVSRGFAHAVKRRLYASQAAARAEQSETGLNLPKQETKITKLPNGITVASLENYSPVSRVSLVVTAGSRYEDGDSVGVSHCLRVASSLSNKSSTGFGLTRNLQQLGSSFTCTSSREHLFYNVESIRDDMESCVGFLREVVTEPAFKPWEVSECQGRLKLDRALLEDQPGVEVMELLHEAAFRRTLGRSLYVPESMIGSYTSNQLHNHVQQCFTSGRMVLVALGVDHDQLCAEGNKFSPYTPTGSHSEPAVYTGGELWRHTRNSLTYAAVACEGAALNGAHLMSSGVLQMIMGTGPYIKYSSGLTSSRLAKAVSSATADPFAISCINANYTDSGLFGFLAAAQAKDMGKVLKAAFGQFAGVTKNGVTEQELARGKKQLKAAVHMYLEQGANTVTDMGEQVIGHGQIARTADMDKHIDAVTVNDVVDLAKRIVNGRASMAAVGNLSHTPTLDELYK